MEPGMDFDDMAEENADLAEIEYIQSKAKPKIPVPPPPPVAKVPRASAGAIETKKLIKEKQESAQIADKIRILTKIELYRQNFPDIANNKKSTQSSPSRIPWKRSMPSMRRLSGNWPQESL